jgi:hypothetical protein
MHEARRAVDVNETSTAFYCGAFIAVSVAMQVATLMFEEVRRLPLWGAVIFFATSYLCQQAHDWLGVSWQVLFGCSNAYFILTMCVGEYFSRRRTRRHRARMAEFERQYESMFEKEHP